MMITKSEFTSRYLFGVSLFVLALLVSSCASESPTPQPTSQPPTATVQPTATQAEATEVTPQESPTAVSEASSQESAPEPTLTPQAAVEPIPSATSAIPTSCEPTPADALGPFYVPDAPERSSVGEGHVLSGLVRSSADCSPIPQAQIEFWLAGPDGEYGDEYRATMFAEEAGAYQFQSHFPPPYSGRPSHIHMRVTAEGYEPLVTQYYPAEGQTEGTFDLVLVPSEEVAAVTPTPQAIEPTLQEYPIPSGSRPHDVAPAPDGMVWYTAQGSGELGRLDPETGETRHIDLGDGSAPHGVIVGPDGAPWITDGGLNAIVRVDPATEEVQTFPLPADSGYANLNTATFDQNDVLWFTGQSGVYGRLDPAVGEVEVFAAPRGRGPYGITTTPGGDVYFASLAGSHIARIDLETAEATPIEPPTPQQGARRVWSDSQGRIWVSEWNTGQLGLFDPASGEWREWPLPGAEPHAYAIYVDDRDMVWLSDFGSNALVRFDPAQESFEVFPLPSPAANVRQLLGRPGEVWGAESGTDKLVVIRTAVPPDSQGESLSPTPATEEAAVPAPSLFDVAWEDRSIFRPGLIDSEQTVLDQLPGASVYHIDLQLGDDLVSLQGQEELRYTNQEDQPLDELYFRLFPNLADGATTIQTLTVNDQPVEPSYELRQSAMRVPLSPALQPGEPVVIQMAFSVQVPQGEGGNYGTFAFSNDVLALPHFYPMIAVYDDEGWNVEIAPAIGDVIYADTSFYLVRVTAPEAQTLVASGIEIDRRNVDGRQVVTFAAGPMRDFYLAASDRYAVTSRTVDGITINSYAPDDLTGGADVALDYAAKAMQSFDERFGAYPFTEFDLVSTTTFALGVEYPGIVAILVDLYEQESGQGSSTGSLMEGVVAHEVAHQWFYSVVGNDQVDEPWLDEAMAQFATLVYYSDVYGPAGANGFRRSLERRWERVDEAAIPIGLPVRDYSSQEYGAIVYGRGPLFVEALSEAMGAEPFAEFLRDYYQQNKWDIATGDAFKQLAEQHCDCDLTALFEAWVYEESSASG